MDSVFVSQNPWIMTPKRVDKPGLSRAAVQPLSASFHQAAGARHRKLKATRRSQSSVPSDLRQNHPPHPSPLLLGQEHGSPVTEGG